MSKQLAFNCNSQEIDNEDSDQRKNGNEQYKRDIKQTKLK